MFQFLLYSRVYFGSCMYFIKRRSGSRFDDFFGMKKRVLALPCRQNPAMRPHYDFQVLVRLMLSTDIRAIRATSGQSSSFPCDSNRSSQAAADTTKRRLCREPPMSCEPSSSCPSSIIMIMKLMDISIQPSPRHATRASNRQLLTITTAETTIALDFIRPLSREVAFRAKP